MTGTSADKNYSELGHGLLVLFFLGINFLSIHFFLTLRDSTKSIP